MSARFVVQEAVTHPDLYGVRRSNRPQAVPTSSSLLYEVRLLLSNVMCLMQLFLLMYEW